MPDKKIFAEGIRFFPPGVAAPEYVLGTISVDVVRFTNFLIKNQQSERMKLSVKRAKSGNIYIEVDTYDPTNRATRSKEEEDVVKEVVFDYPEATVEIEDIPF